MAKQLQYINWFDSPHWSADITLGTNGERYTFTANWNDRDESWSIAITQDEHILLQGIKLVLGVDLLAHCHSEYKPKCVLIAATENMNIERISFDNMANSDVKLFHINNEGFIS
jgi:hypothetical protein